MKVKISSGDIVSEKKFRTGLRDVITDLKAIQQKIFDTGLYKTYHEIDKTLKCVGWEAAHILTKNVVKEKKHVKNSSRIK